MYCCSCDVCQRMLKSGKPAKAMMQLMPIISKPFTHISIDILGTHSKTNKGNRFAYT